MVAGGISAAIVFEARPPPPPAETPQTLRGPRAPADNRYIIHPLPPAYGHYAYYYPSGPPECTEDAARAVIFSSSVPSTRKKHKVERWAEKPKAG